MRPRKVKEQAELSSRALLKRLREVAQPPGRKGVWLRHLSDKRLLEVYFRLKAGQASHHICKIAQQEWRVMPGSETKTLAQGLRKFRDKLVGLLFIEKGTATVLGAKERREKAAQQNKRARKIAKKVDGMQVLADLIATQWSRVQAMAAAETKKDFFRGTDSAVKILGEVLGKFIQFEMDLGILDAKPAKFQVEMKHEFDCLLKNVITDDGSRMIEATQRLLRAAEGRTVELVERADGTFAREGDSEIDTA